VYAEMTTMFKVTSTWSGFTGAPGYTNLFFEHSDPPSTGVQQAVDNARQLFNACKNALPSAVTVTTSPTVELIEDIDGELVDVMTATTPPAAVVGTDTTAYAAPSGLVIAWLSPGVYRGNRVRGKTFLVPIGGVNYQTDGSLATGLPAAITVHAEAFLAATGPTFGVWCRPQKAHLNSAGEAVPASDGKFFEATSSRVADRVSVLRSRRD
jgi:hypothetical protein